MESWHPSAGLGGTEAPAKFQPGAPRYATGFILQWLMPGAGFVYLQAPAVLLALLFVEVGLMALAAAGAPGGMLVALYLAGGLGAYHLVYIRRYGLHRLAFTPISSRRRTLSVALLALLLLVRIGRALLPGS